MIGEDDLLEAVEGELFGDLVFLFGDAVGVEGEDIAGRQGDDGVDVLGAGKDADDGAGYVELNGFAGAGWRRSGGLWPPLEYSRMRRVALRRA